MEKGANIEIKKEQIIDTGEIKWKWTKWEKRRARTRRRTWRRTRGKSSDWILWMSKI